jgi:hypothetical protein
MQEFGRRDPGYFEGTLRQYYGLLTKLRKSSMVLAIEHFERGFTLAELLDIRGVPFKTQPCVIEHFFFQSFKVFDQQRVITFWFCFWRNSPQWAMASSFLRFLDHTLRLITVGRTPLDE